MNLNFKILCRFNFKFCTCQHIPSRHVLFNNWPKTFTNMSLSFVVLRKSCFYEQGLKQLRYLWVPGVGSLSVGAQVVPDGARSGQLLPEGLRCRRQIVPRMIPDAASQDAAICCPMLPGAARSCQMFPDATRQSQIVVDATNIAMTNTIPGAYTNANANHHHHTNTNTNTSNYPYHYHHNIAKASFASRLSALYRDVPVACTTMMMGGQPHIRRQSWQIKQGPMTKHLIMFMTFKASRQVGMFYIFMPKLLETEEPSPLQRRILQSNAVASGHFAF